MLIQFIYTFRNEELDETQDLIIPTSDNSTQDQFLELSLVEIMDDAKKGSFPKKTFFIDGKIKSYSQRLQFFKSERKLNKIASSNPIEFHCKFCNASLKATIPSFTNLTKHLRQHQDFNKWLDLFKKFYDIKPTCITKDEYDFVLYIVSSNTAMAQFKNNFFRQILRVDMPSYNVFRYKLLDVVYKKMIDFIDAKMEEAISISLVLDICPNVVMVDFIGVAAVCSDKTGSKETFIIGLESMDGTHTAENVKLRTEQIVNAYKFNKAKISSVVCDQGSFLVRCFKRFEGK